MTFPFGYVLPILATGSTISREFSQERDIVMPAEARLQAWGLALILMHYDAYMIIYAFKFGFEIVLRSKYAMTTMLLLLLIYTVYYST